MKNAMIACNTTKLNAIIVHRVVFISSATVFFFVCSRAFAIWLLKLRGTSTCSLQWFCGVSRWKFVHFVIKFIHLLLNNGIYTVWCVHFEVSFHFGFVLPCSETLFATKFKNQNVKHLQLNENGLFIVALCFISVYNLVFALCDKHRAFISCEWKFKRLYRNQPIVITEIKLGVKMWMAI